jgi:hypothetical protein
MTPLCACSDAAQVIETKAYLPRNAAFFLLASITVSFISSSSALTPLSAPYQALWGFPPVTGTFIFAVYAISVLLALLFWRSPFRSPPTAPCAASRYRGAGELIRPLANRSNHIG